MPTVVNRLQPITLAGMKDVTFGDWVRKQRSDRGWSQSRVARELSRIDAEYKGDPSYISKLERGDVGTPLLESRERFHKIFHTSEQDLIDLGIVKQYDQWGREITHRAPATITTLRDQLPALIATSPEGIRRYLQALGATFVLGVDVLTIEWPAPYGALFATTPSE